MVIPGNDAPRRSRMRPAAWLAVAVLSVCGICAEAWLARHRPGKTPAATEGLIAALGGFRSLAAEAIWFRADLLQEEGRYVELAQLASALTFLEPHTPEIWGYAAWNLAYNISVMMPTSEDRWRWVHAGLRLLRDEGLRLNPGDSDICREIAWLFQIKIGADVDSAAPLYREKWAAIVRDVEKRDAWHELSMEKPLMELAASMYNIRDWTKPHASAVYWALCGLASGDVSAQTAKFLNMIISFSSRQLQS